MNPTIKARIESIRRGEVPEGYKRTKIGIVPNEWGNVLFSTLFESFSVYTEDLEKYPLYSLTIEEGITPKTERYERSFLVKKKNAYKVMRPNDFAYNPMNLRFGAVARYKGEKLISVSGYYDIFTTKSKLDLEFMDNFLIFDNMITYYNKVSIGSLIEKQRVHFSNFLNFELPLPPLTERNRIAEILAGQDRVIALKEELLAEKQKQKKYLMQQLLTGKKRLPGFSGEWINNNLEDICDVLDAFRRPYNRDQRAQMKGVYPYYGANGIIDYIDNYIFDEPIILLAEDGGDFEHYFQKPIAQKVIGKCWVNNHAHVLRAKQGYYIDFIFYLLEHKDIRKYINGTTRSKLTQDDMLGIQFYYPKNKKEQTAIAEILSTADKEIELLKKDIEQEKLKKKSLMQLLLTGIVRVSA